MSDPRSMRSVAMPPKRQQVSRFRKPRKRRVARSTLQKKSRNELLRQAVMKLSPDHREIIDLVYYHEKSVEECAVILGIPAATVKTRMFYGRKKLAELVQEA